MGSRATKAVATVVAAFSLIACGSDGPAASNTGLPIPSVEPIEAEALPPDGPVLTEPITSGAEPPPSFDVYATIPGESIPVPLPIPSSERLMEWQVADEQFSFELPTRFAIDTRAGREPIDPAARNELVDVLYSWVDLECQCTVKFAIQPKPPEDQPIYRLEPYETVSSNGLTWSLIDMGDDDRTNTIAIATTESRMLVVTAPADQLNELVKLVEVRSGAS